MLFGKHEKSAPREDIRVGRRLGKGGYAETFHAEVMDRALAVSWKTTAVAVKVPERGKEGALQQEIELNGTLKQKRVEADLVNLVRYLGSAVYDGRVVMIMEYISGGSLRDLLGQIGSQNRLTVTDSVHIARGMLRGLAVLHDERIFHRDIKPENVLMDGRTPKIGDLGIGRTMRYEELAHTGDGTVYYMAPERLRHNASFPADIWAVGVTLYEMLTGQLPFYDDELNVLEVKRKIESHTETPVHEVAPGIPTAISEVIAKALRKDPDERHKSAKEMIAALDEAEDPDRGLAAEMQRIDEAVNRGEPPVVIYNKVIELTERFPNKVAAYVKAATVFNRGQEFARTAEIIEKGLPKTGADAVLLYHQATAYGHLGRKQEAIVAMDRAVALGLPGKLATHGKMLLSMWTSGGT